MKKEKEIRFKIQDRDELKGKVSVQIPIFELVPSDTLTEVDSHGYSFLVGTNDSSLSTKEHLEKVILL